MPTYTCKYSITLFFTLILILATGSAYATGGFLVDLAQGASKWMDDLATDGSKIGKHLDEIGSEGHHLDNLVAKGFTPKARYIRNFDEIAQLGNTALKKKEFLNLLRAELINGSEVEKSMKQVSHALLNDAYKGQKVPFDAEASYQLLVESSERYGDNALLRTAHYLDSDEGSRLYKVFSDAKPIKRVEGDEMKLFLDGKNFDDIKFKGDLRCAKLKFQNYMESFKSRYGELDIADQHLLMLNDGLDHALKNIYKTYSDFIIEQAMQELGAEALLPLKKISIEKGIVKVELFEMCGSKVSFEHQFKEQDFALTADGREVKIVPQLVGFVGKFKHL